jgi:hypothetical protein
MVVGKEHRMSAHGTTLESSNIYSNKGVLWALLSGPA